VVQDPNRDGDLGVPPILGPEPQAVANDALPAAEAGFNQSANVVLGGFLPRHPSVLGAVLQELIARCWLGFSVRTRHCHGTGRHDHSSVRRVLRHGFGHAGLVVSTVSNTR
jgi:hypothetical protein